MRKKRLARLGWVEEHAWLVYFSWFCNNHVDNRPSRADKYTWSMMQNEFPRLKNYDGCFQGQGLGASDCGKHTEAYCQGGIVQGAH
jgi:hypothetical protein